MNTYRIRGLRFRWFSIGAFTSAIICGAYSWGMMNKVADANWEDRAAMAGLTAQVAPIRDVFDFAVDGLEMPPKP